MALPMGVWRSGTAVCLFILVVLPLAAPVGEILFHPEAWLSWSEVGRLLSLVRTTFLLVATTVSVTLPAGIAIAWLLYRTDLPWRRCFRACVFLTLFVPLPLFVTAWQAA